jgi:very-short-patch-repair endonuclease
MAAGSKVRVEDLLLADLVRETGNVWVREWRPTELRRWTVDLACLPMRLCIEIDGERFHSSAKQRRSDAEKSNFLTAYRYKILRYPASSVNTKKRRERIVEQIVRVLYGAQDEEADCCVLNGD